MLGGILAFTVGMVAGLTIDAQDGHPLPACTATLSRAALARPDAEEAIAALLEVSEDELVVLREAARSAPVTVRLRSRGRALTVFVP